MTAPTDEFTGYTPPTKPTYVDPEAHCGLPGCLNCTHDRGCYKGWLDDTIKLVGPGMKTGDPAEPGTTIYIQTTPCPVCRPELSIACTEAKSATDFTRRVHMPRDEG